MIVVGAGQVVAAEAREERRARLAHVRVCIWKMMKTF